ncbi:MAG: plastocyanin/azurin family copper-binding protein [Thaumarchaeota archaeon]|nr:plastocyanin/azurin family copper-binding protein [Nitrososphaerota archaeon]
MEPKTHRAMSTTVGAVIIIAIIVVVGVGIYLSGPSNPSTSTTNSTSSPMTITSSPSSSPTSTSGGTASVTIPQGASAGSNFSPAALTVAPGTTITWTDQDSGAPHNVYFTSMPSGASISSSPSPTLQKGDTYSVTLTTPGTYKFECQFHSTWMQGTITVS